MNKPRQVRMWDVPILQYHNGFRQIQVLKDFAGRGGMNLTDQTVEGDSFTERSYSPLDIHE